MKFSFIRMVEIVLIAIIAILASVWLVSSFIKSAKTPTIRAEVEKEYQEKRKRLESEYAKKEAALKDRERKAAYHIEQEKSFASRWQQLTDREHKVEERERKLKKKGADNALDRLAEQEKRVEILGAIQDEIEKMLGMSDKLMKLQDEFKREISSSSYIKICDIGFEYNEIYLKVNDLLLRAWLNEGEDLRSYKDPHYREAV